MDPTPLTSSELIQVLRELSEWSGDETGLKRKIEFEDFRGAMRFMQACVDGIDLQNHHPVWTNKYNGVDIMLNTFDIGGKVSQKDVKLAKHIDAVLTKQGESFGVILD